MSADLLITFRYANGVVSSERVERESVWWLYREVIPGAGYPARRIRGDALTCGDVVREKGSDERKTVLY